VHHPRVNESATRRLHPSLLPFVIALALAACGPTIDPAAKADLDARIAKLRDASITIPAPKAGAFTSMPSAPGQWARYRMTLQDGEPKLLTQKVIGEEGGALWYEMVHETYEGRTVEQFLVAAGNGPLELRAVRTKDAKGRVTTLSQAALWAAKNQMGPTDIYWMDAVAVSRSHQWRDLPQASTTVPAGLFEGCYRSHTMIKGSRHPWAQDAWSHPDVPLGGLVRKQDDRGFVVELVAYGMTGAHSDF
jgi:hypothetical protein